MQLRTILVPVDLSEYTGAIVDWAIGLARPFGARLILVHAIERPPGMDATSTVELDGERLPILEHLRRAAGARLTAEVARARAAGLQVDGHLAEAAPAAAILQALAVHGADLVVMGTHGRTGLRRLALGSVAEEVGRHAQVPVLTVRTIGAPPADASACPPCDEKLEDLQWQVRAEQDG